MALPPAYRMIRGEISVRFNVFTGKQLYSGGLTKLIFENREGKQTMDVREGKIAGPNVIRSDREPHMGMAIKNIR